MNDKEPVRFVIIDDHPLLRKGLQQLADISPDIEMIGESDNGEQGLALVLALQPDLVLLDMNMPGMNGLEALEGLKRLDPAPKVVFLTVSDASEDILGALRRGADGYLLKDMDPEDILEEIRGLGEGHMAISEYVSDRVALALRNENLKAKESKQLGLTDREREILMHISLGESNKVIARKLDIAETTVKVHVKHLLKKLGLKSRVDAAVWAVTHKDAL